MKIRLEIETEEAKLLHKMLYYIGEDESYPDPEYNIVAGHVSDLIQKSFRDLSKEDFERVFKIRQAPEVNDKPIMVWQPPKKQKQCCFVAAGRFFKRFRITFN